MDSVTEVVLNAICKLGVRLVKLVLKSIFVQHYLMSKAGLNSNFFKKYFLRPKIT